MSTKEKIKRCTMCNKIFDMWDLLEDFSYQKWIGYGSVHDLGDYFPDGGDGIKLLDWLCERQTFYHIALHMANPVGRDNMLRLIKRHWR